MNKKYSGVVLNKDNEYSTIPTQDITGEISPFELLHFPMSSGHSPFSHMKTPAHNTLTGIDSVRSSKATLSCKKQIDNSAAHFQHVLQSSIDFSSLVSRQQESLTNTNKELVKRSLAPTEPTEPNTTTNTKTKKQSKGTRSLALISLNTSIRPAHKEPVIRLSVGNKKGSIKGKNLPKEQMEITLKRLVDDPLKKIQRNSQINKSAYRKTMSDKLVKIIESPVGIAKRARMSLICNHTKTVSPDIKIDKEDEFKYTTIPELQKMRLKRIYNNFLAKSGKDNAADIYAKYFTNDAHEFNLSQFETKRKVIKIKRKPKIQIHSQNIIRPHTAEMSPDEKRKRIKSYGRWYINPNDFANKLSNINF